MRKIIILFVLVALIAIAGVGWLVQRGAEARAVRRVIDEAQEAALAGMNAGDPSALDEYFATEAEGAQPSGLAETQRAYQEFVQQLAGGSYSVQFHSFSIQDLEVHENARLARVTYRLHFSVIYSSQVTFGAVATQSIALLKTPRGWRISGGDAAQLEEIRGAWPPR